MRGVASPPLQLCGVVGLAALDLYIPIAFARPAAVLASILGAYAIAVAATILYVPPRWNEVVFCPPDDRDAHHGPLAGGTSRVIRYGRTLPFSQTNVIESPRVLTSRARDSAGS